MKARIRLLSLRDRLVKDHLVTPPHDEMLRQIQPAIDHIGRLEVALNACKRTHYYCEDTWYSCPKHPEGCANDDKGDECDCGADQRNKMIDDLLKHGK